MSTPDLSLMSLTDHQLNAKLTAIATMLAISNEGAENQYLIPGMKPYQPCPGGFHEQYLKYSAERERRQLAKIQPQNSP